GMAVIETEAALSLGLVGIFRGEAGINPGARLALLQYVDIGAVGGREVVIVEAVLELQFPVAVERVAAGAGHELELAAVALVDDEIEEGTGVAKEFVERRHVRGQAREHEAAIG